MSKTVELISLGCSKNLVDSEVMLGLLSEGGYEISLNGSKADITIINTCAFIESAKQESIDTILAVAEDMESDQRLIVTGCLAQRYVEVLSREIQEVSAFIGTGEFHKIVDVCDSLYFGLKRGNKSATPLAYPGPSYEEGRSSYKERSNQQSAIGTPEYLYDHRTPRMILTPPHYAYLKIAEGCDRKCTFCAIPMMRGSHRSRSIESVISEAKSLADGRHSFINQDLCFLTTNGVKELILISQDLTYYGIDRYGKIMLPKLLHELAKIEKLEWIRLMYTYPSEIDDELLEIIAQEPKICNYLDMPIQHIDDTILRRMNRKTSSDLIRSKIEQIRKVIPEISLRTTLLVGFPGETERQFESLVDFIQEAKFDHLGVFAYSQEDGTPAARLEKQIPEEIKQERFDYLANVQSGIAIKKRKKMIGRKMNVLVDEIDRPSSIARTEGQAPEVDDVVYIQDEKIPTGEFVSVRIKSTCGFDFVALKYND